jgi:hypothetical protein
MQETGFIKVEGLAMHGLVDRHNGEKNTILDYQYSVMVRAVTPLSD